MKLFKKLFFFTLLFFTSFGLYAQKFAYVDTDYILTKVPEFIQFEEKINDFTKQWQSEIESAYMK